MSKRITLVITSTAAFITPFMMSGMNGFQVLEKLKSQEETINIPVIMLSGRGDDTSRIKAMQLFNEVFLTKPIEAAEVKTTIEDVLKKRESL